MLVYQKPFQNGCASLLRWQKHNKMQITAIKFAGHDEEGFFLEGLGVFWSGQGVSKREMEDHSDGGKYRIKIFQ